MIETVPHFKVFKNEPPSFLRVGRDLLDQRLYEDAIARFKQALALDPECAHAHLAIAHARYAQKLILAAELHCRLAIGIDSLLHEAQSLLARIRFELGDHAGAEYWSQSVLRIDYEQHVAHALLGLIHRDRDELPEGIECLKLAIRYDDQDEQKRAGYWYCLGDLYQRAGAYPEAIQAYRQAIEANYDFPHPHYYLGEVLLELGRYEEADVAFETAKLLNQAVWLEDLSRALAAARDEQYDLAVHISTHILEQSSKLALAHLVLGEVALAQQRHQSAMGHFDQALELNPSPAAAHYKRAVAQRGMGRAQDAQADLAEALRRDPDMEQARIELREIEAEIAALRRN